MNAQTQRHEIFENEEREARIKRAMDAHLAQREAAAAISTSIAEGQEPNENTPPAVVEAIGNSIMTICLALGDRDGDEFMHAMVASDICYAATRHIKWTEDKLRSQATYILRLCSSHRGGDVDDEKIMRATEFQEQLQGSLERWEMLLEAAKNAYETVTNGKVWMPSAPGQPVEVKADTASKRAALNAAARWLPQAGRQVGARNGVPNGYRTMPDGRPDPNDNIPF
jgi:hypothetical protein